MTSTLNIVDMPSQRYRETAEYLGSVAYLMSQSRTHAGRSVGAAVTLAMAAAQQRFAQPGADEAAAADDPDVHAFAHPRSPRIRSAILGSDRPARKPGPARRSRRPRAGILG